MIGKIAIGRGFGGALRYALAEEKGYVLDSNMAGDTARELAAEFGALRELRPNLHRAVLHASLSLDPGETLSDAQWREIGRRYLHDMGFTDNQYVLIRHTDTAHEHVHLIANRITHRGEAVSDSQNYPRQEAVLRQIEQDYGLTQVMASHQAESRALTQGEIERTLRTGEPSTRQQLQELCRAAARDCHGFTDYMTRLEATGVELIPVIQLEGAKIAGLSYRLDGVAMKGSDLGKAYAPAGLAKQGITYEQDRDLAAARHCIERETARATRQPDRDLAASPAPERGGLERDLGAFGPSDGRLDRRDAADLGADRRYQPAASEAVPGQDHHRHAALDPDLGPSPGRRPSALERSEPDQGDVHRPGPSDRDRFSHPHERILALAGTHPDHRSPDRRPGSGELDQIGIDRTARAAQKQAEALGGQRFEVGIHDPATGRRLHRDWDRAELGHGLGWLKRMNARGHDIYLRPAGEHAYVLVDGLTRAALQQMDRTGFTPAITLETHPGHYQAWVRLSHFPVAPDIRQQAARELARQFGGDTPHTHAYGRLAGFTTQDPAHRNAAGQNPYVLVHDCQQMVATAGHDCIQRIQHESEQHAAQQTQQMRLEAIQRAVETRKGQDPPQDYQQQAKRHIGLYGPSTDYAQMDGQIAQDMAKSGHFSQRDIQNAIRACSPHLEACKAGHVEDYAARTAEQAWQAPEVVGQRQEHQQQRQQDYGLE